MDFNNMKNLLNRMAGKYYPGIDICIRHKRKTVFRYQAGYSDIENKKAVDPSAVYSIFSCSKPMTCAAALQLYEKGYYLMSDPVSEYLPEFKEMYVRELTENGDERLVKAQGPITIQHLFTMTAGLNYNINTPYIQKVQERTGGKCPTGEIVKAIAKNPLDFHPGQHFKYSLCHDVLGRLIEVWSGMSFGAYMKQNVFDVCGMKHTGFAPTQQMKEKMPPMYVRQNNPIAFARRENSCEFRLGTEYESGGAGIISCVDDYIEFADAMANGGVTARGERLLAPKTIDLMRTNMLSQQQLRHMNVANAGYGYGLGVRTFVNSQTKGLLSNPGEFGWDGAAGCFVLMDPSEELAVFCAENVRNACNHEGPHRIVNVLYAELSKNETLTF